MILGTIGMAVGAGAIGRAVLDLMVFGYHIISVVTGIVGIVFFLLGLRRFKFNLEIFYGTIP